MAHSDLYTENLSSFICYSLVCCSICFISNWFILYILYITSFSFNLSNQSNKFEVLRIQNVQQTPRLWRGENQLCPLHVASAWFLFLFLCLWCLHFLYLFMCTYVCLCVCVYVCVVCLPGCWTNSREIILPQSLGLSGQSDEEQVIFNTAGGLLKYQRSQTPCLWAQEPISFLPLCILFHSGIIPNGLVQTVRFVKQTMWTEEMWR